MNELKAELEYCRKKWALARALTNDSEEQCRQLRHEFTQRKIQDQHSGESGYSDEHVSSDGDDDEVKPKSGAMKAKKFDDNLVMFDRTISPTFIDRRQSESPTIHRDFSHALCLFSRAQSEPPRVASPMTVIETIVENFDEEVQTFEILNLIPDPIEENLCVASTSLQNENDDERYTAVVTPSPEIIDSNMPLLKAHLRKCRKEIMRQERSRNGQATAEDLFMKLMNRNRVECDTCSSTTESIDEDEYDNLDEIQEIPMDDVIEEAAAKVNEIIEEKIDETSTSQTITTTTTTEDDFEILGEKEQDFLKRREERLQRLEAEAKAFYDKMAKNREKGQQLNNHLNEVHQNFLHRERERAKHSDDEMKPEEDEKHDDQDQPSTSASKQHHNDDAEQK
jgi:hypothetical protein